jgi:hypothetical protein
VCQVNRSNLGLLLLRVCAPDEWLFTPCRWLRRDPGRGVGALVRNTGGAVTAAVLLLIILPPPAVRFSARWKASSRAGGFYGSYRHASRRVETDAIFVRAPPGHTLGSVTHVHRLYGDTRLNTVSAGTRLSGMACKQQVVGSNPTAGSLRIAAHRAP